MASLTYPADFFHSQKIEPKAGYCFVLMPFDAPLREIFETVKETLEGPPWNFTCRRADDFFAGGHVLTDILRGIAEAEIVLADLTGRNPNVFYELGIAHMHKPPSAIVLLTQGIDAVPFDLQGFRRIVYTQSIQGARELRKDLANALEQITKPVYRFEIRQGETYEFPHRLGGESRCLYDFSVFSDYLGVDFAKYTLRVRRYVAGQAAATEVDVNGSGLEKGKSEPIPKIPWDLRLERSDGQRALFSVVQQLQPPESS